MAGLARAGALPGAFEALGVLWGKSEEKAGGRKNLLLSHLLDTAAVAERMWDGFLAPSTKRMLDEIAGGPGRGRRFFAWLCGVWHPDATNGLPHGALDTDCQHELLDRTLTVR